MRVVRFGVDDGHHVDAVLGGLLEGGEFVYRLVVGPS